MTPDDHHGSTPTPPTWTGIFFVKNKLFSLELKKVVYLHCQTIQKYSNK